jgi:alkylation response protein AidB-like acyl-CoA dehydrogenase
MQRTAFGKPISSFGAIRHKLAEMAIRTWVVESMVYRTAALLSENDPELAAECSILKVFGSETLDFVVDEAVQIFGGYGFTSEYPVERYYRDARVNRIFEGTNEINRLLIGRLLFKRNVFEARFSASGETAAAKEALKLVAELALDVQKDGMKDAQEVLMHLADMAIEIYAMDSALCRAARPGAGNTHTCMAKTFVNDALPRVSWSATQTLASLAEGESLRDGLDRIRRLFSQIPLDTVRMRRQIAEHVLDTFEDF